MLTRRDDLFPAQKCNTYVNHSLNHESCIDYLLVSAGCFVNNFVVLDPEVNFSDHLPLMMSFSISSESVTSCVIGRSYRNNTTKILSSKQIQLRWDKCDRDYSCTGLELEPLLTNVDNTLIAYELRNETAPAVSECIESSYITLVSVLQTAANNFVPKCQKRFFKFWWDEELKILKDVATESNKIWKSVGKPRQGPIFLKRQFFSGGISKAY